MKKLIIVVIALLVITESLSAQSLIPEIELGEAKFNLSGYSSIFSEPDDFEKWDLNNFRLRPSFEFGEFRLFGEVNLADEKNPLRYMQLEYSVSESWKIRAGRLFLAAGYYTPGPFQVETIRFPMTYFPPYGWGVQLDGNFGDGWRFIADIGGRSAVPFDSDQNWDFPEMSARLQKSFDDFKVAGNTQISKEYQRFGVDVTWQVREDFYLRQGTYSAVNQDKDDDFGVYILNAYRPLEWLELHSQLDYWQNTGQNLVMTNGVRLLPDKNLSVTFDYETVLDGEMDDRVLARVLYRF